jgi:hypothetical protein
VTVGATPTGARATAIMMSSAFKNDLQLRLLGQLKSTVHTPIHEAQKQGAVPALTKKTTHSNPKLSPPQSPPLPNKTHQTPTKFNTTQQSPTTKAIEIPTRPIKGGGGNRITKLDSCSDSGTGMSTLVSAHEILGSFDCLKRKIARKIATQYFFSHGIPTAEEGEENH